MFHEVVWSDTEGRYHVGRQLTRKNLVFQLRTQDGGAHYDAELRDGAYVDLAVRKQIGMYRQLPNGEVVPFDQNPHLVSMRQIAWEIEQSLMDVPGGPDLPPRIEFPPPRFHTMESPV